MCIHVQSLTYMHPDEDVLFCNVNFSIAKGDKIALIGDNGSGKSTLMQLINRKLHPSEGQIVCSEIPYCVPQHFGQFNNLTIAGALRIEHKLQAFHAILEGDASVKNFTTVADDWNIEERAVAALSEWGLEGVSLSHPMHSLSGGEKTKVFLAGMVIYAPTIILMDEPTNHLDDHSREQLYRFINDTSSGVLVVSHDRTLLNLLNTTYELTAKGVAYYAGNYDFYKEQKGLMVEALRSRLEEKEKELRKARKLAREMAERQQKRDVRGEKSNQKKGFGKMAMNTFRDQAEKATSRLSDVHSGKIQSITESVTDIRKALPDIKAMKIDFNSSSLHSGKILITAKGINYAYDGKELWKSPLNFVIKSGERIHLKGGNGSGKTTLLKLITSDLSLYEGELEVTDNLTFVFLDQEYSLIRNERSVLEQLSHFNTKFYDHELKTILNRFLFPVSTWDKKCNCLSGGEKMKLSLCCLMVSAQTPDIFIVDEPTNNIDITSMEILTAMLKDYRGTLLIVSHDTYFVEQVGMDRTINIG